MKNRNIILGLLISSLALCFEVQVANAESAACSGVKANAMTTCLDAYKAKGITLSGAAAHSCITGYTKTTSTTGYCCTKNAAIVCPSTFSGAAYGGLNPAEPPSMSQCFYSNMITNAACKSSGGSLRAEGKSFTCFKVLPSPNQYTELVVAVRE